MADIEKLMISKIINEENLLAATKDGVRHDWFEDPDHIKVFTWISEHQSRYGRSPSRETLKQEFPNYRFSVVDEPYEYYVDRFRRKRERSILVDTMIAMQQAIDEDDTKTAEMKASAGLMKLGRETSKFADGDVTRNTKSRYSKYETAKKNKGKLTGIATGFPRFDFVSGGYHPEQFILFGGAPKQCKSYMLMHSAIAAQCAGAKVLFMTFEMSKAEMDARYDAMCSGVSASHVVRGYINEDELKHLRRGMSMLKHRRAFTISADIAAQTTVMTLAAKIDEYHPDVLFIDGCYLMENDIGAEPLTSRAFTAISRGIKRLAQRSKIPVVATTQSLLSKMGKDGAVTMSSLGWTSAWAQDADVICGTEKLDGNRVLIRGVAGRNVPSFESTMHCNWDETLFQELEVSDEDEEDDE